MPTCPHKCDGKVAEKRIEHSIENEGISEGMVIYEQLKGLSTATYLGEKMRNLFLRNTRRPHANKVHAT